MHWRRLHMDLHLAILLLLFQFLGSSLTSRSGDMWDHLSLRYGVWYKLPRTETEAKNEGYIRQNDICKTEKYHGFLYAKEGNINTMPIYDLNGFIVGIQSAIPGNMKGYNSANKTINLPPHGIMPPIMLGEMENKIQMYTVTAYFRHPGVICRPSARNISLGKGLFIQMTYNPEKEFEQIPLESKDLSSDWTMGNCIPKMGLHFFKNLTRSLPCEHLYPLFLMYDMEGKLGAFGWTFQGRPMRSHSNSLSWFHLTPELYPFIFEKGKLPACMMNKNFQVFGIKVWLKDPDTLLCKRESSTKQRVYKAPMTAKPTTMAVNIITTKPMREKDVNIINKSSKTESVTLLKILSTVFSIFIVSFVRLL